jgi:hypothetical protein
MLTENWLFESVMTIFIKLAQKVLSLLGFFLVKVQPKISELEKIKQDHFLLGNLLVIS